MVTQFRSTGRKIMNFNLGSINWTTVIIAVVLAVIVTKVWK